MEWKIPNLMKRVLVVDDNPDILHLVQIILKNNGFEVLVSPKGDDVLAQTENFCPQVILLDVFLSGHDGRQICRELKENPKTNHIPVIMFSAHTGNEEIIRDCNADDFIAKPFEVNELIQKVNYWLMAPGSNNEQQVFSELFSFISNSNTKGSRHLDFFPHTSV
jgi:DNA-binding response OmpR family regulator